jgi:hypothetical protein
LARLTGQAGILTAAALALSGMAAGASSAAHVRAASGPPAAAGCVLGGHAGTAVKHVIYLQFDNVHYTRDDPNVPSDLQQMPNLLHFITGQGTLISHEHTPLIAHTADDIVTSEPACTAAITATRSPMSTSTTSRTAARTRPARSRTGPTRSWTTTPGWPASRSATTPPP